MKFGYTIIYVNSVADVLAFVTDDVQAAYQNAVDCGASPIRGPVEKPWGQAVAYVRSIEGTLIELCSPMGG